jgi:CRP-like cAMP-binding protein
MSQADQVAELLSRAPLFQNLSAQELAACAPHFRKVEFGKNELLFGRGDPGDKVYLIADGRVRLAITTEEGRELSFRHAIEGDLIGEVAALDGETRTADATALTPVTAFVLDRKAFDKIRTEHQSISEAVIRFLCRRLRDTSDQLETIALYPLEVRVARLLLVALGGRTAPPGKRVPLELGFSQSELAFLLGASRPKINAALGALEDAGAVGRTQDRLFCDPDKLAAIAQRQGG